MNRVVRRIFLLAFFVVVAQLTNPGYCVLAQSRLSHGANMDQNLDAMIDALVNHNPAPKIIKISSSELQPRFDLTYNWKEYKRVVASLEAIASRPIPAMWQRLVAHGRDDRYCLTFDDQAASADFYAVNWTVGDACKAIAEFQLCAPVRHAMSGFLLDGEAVKLPLSALDEIPNWGHDNSKKSLAAFQIEVCQQAVKDVKELSESHRESNDQDAIRNCVARLEATIAQLKKSKVGSCERFKFPGDRFVLYDAKKSANIHEQLKTANKSK